MPSKKTTKLSDTEKAGFQLLLSEESILIMNAVPRGKKTAFLTGAIKEKFKRDKGKKKLFPPPSFQMYTYNLVRTIAADALQIYKNLEYTQRGRWTDLAVKEKAHYDKVKQEKEAEKMKATFPELVGKKLYKVMNGELISIYTIANVKNGKAFINVASELRSFNLPLAAENYAIEEPKKPYRKAAYYTLETESLKTKYGR